MAVNEVHGTGPGNMGDVFSRRALGATTMERITWIKEGVDAKVAEALLERLKRSRSHRLAALTKLHAAAKRKAKRGVAMANAESEFMLGVAALVGQVQAMVEEAGAPEGFDAILWFRDWLAEPVPALGGVPPGELIDTFEGRQLVSSALAQIQSGVYA